MDKMVISRSRHRIDHRFCTYKNVKKMYSYLDFSIAIGAFRTRWF